MLGADGDGEGLPDHREGRQAEDPADDGESEQPGVVDERCDQPGAATDHDGGQECPAQAEPVDDPAPPWRAGRRGNGQCGRHEARVHVVHVQREDDVQGEDGADRDDRATRDEAHEQESEDSRSAQDRAISLEGHFAHPAKSANDTRGRLARRPRRLGLTSAGVARR